MEDRIWGNFIPLLPGSASHVLEQPCVTLPPYPRIFSPLLSRQGFLPDDLSSYSAAGNVAPYSYLAIENHPEPKKGKGSFSEFVGKIMMSSKQPLSASKTSAYREHCGVELGKF